MASDYQQWCADRGVTHAHCPGDCDHPQPFVLNDGRLVCGVCAFSKADPHFCEMIPCVPEICEART